MNLEISIPDGLYAAAEQVAKQLRVSRSELYRRALRAYLGVHRDSGVTDALNAVYATEPSAIDPVLAQLQSACLRSEEW